MEQPFAPLIRASESHRSFRGKGCSVNPGATQVPHVYAVVHLTSMFEWMMPDPTVPTLSDNRFVPVTAVWGGTTRPLTGRENVAPAHPEQAFTVVTMLAAAPHWLVM